MQVHLAQVNANVSHFGQLCRRLHRVWPGCEMVCLAEHQGTQPKVALTPLLLYSCLRVNGLMFLMPGLVSPNLPRRSPCRRPMAISRQRPSR